VYITRKNPNLNLTFDYKESKFKNQQGTDLIAPKVTLVLRMLSQRRKIEILAKNCKTFREQNPKFHMLVYL
jgi:UDP-N-acetylenolpyruvoylglucosamine reductase